MGNQKMKCFYWKVSGIGEKPPFPGENFVMSQPIWAKETWFLRRTMKLQLHKVPIECLQKKMKQ